MNIATNPPFKVKNTRSWSKSKPHPITSHSALDARYEGTGAAAEVELLLVLPPLLPPLPLLLLFVLPLLLLLVEALELEPEEPLLLLPVAEEEPVLPVVWDVVEVAAGAGIHGV